MIPATRLARPYPRPGSGGRKSTITPELIERARVWAAEHADAQGRINNAAMERELGLYTSGSVKVILAAKQTPEGWPWRGGAMHGGGNAGHGPPKAPMIDQVALEQIRAGKLPRWTPTTEPEADDCGATSRRYVEEFRRRKRGSDTLESLASANAVHRRMRGQA